MCAAQMLKESAGMTLGYHHGSTLFYKKSSPESPGKLPKVTQQIDEQDGVGPSGPPLSLPAWRLVKPLWSPAQGDSASA